MKLGPAPKTYTIDGHRTVHPKITLERVEPLCELAGVTEIKEITHLDRIGIPVFAIRRPTAEEGAITIYKGKGASLEQAKVSAIMEALERYSAEINDRPVERDFFKNKLKSGDLVDPRTLILPPYVVPHVMHQPLAWVRGYDLMSRRQVWVPACAVFHPYRPRNDMPIFRSNTNGLASGNVMEEAVLHGLCELIERDAWSICEFRREVRADIEVDEDSKLIWSLLDRISSQGISIHLKDLTSDLGVPTIAAVCDDYETRDPALLTIGVGTHLNPEIAVIRAITEVAQSRATALHISEENPAALKSTRELGYDRVKKLNSMWFSESGKKIGIDDLPHLDTADIFDDILVLLKRLKERGFEQVVAVDLTMENIRIPVVRMVVPGLEVYTMDQERTGPRLMGV